MISPARITTACGMPAICATWMPKLCSLPPSLSLRRNTTLLPTSFTDTLKLRMRGSRRPVG
jgi:hypothetical protein